VRDLCGRLVDGIILCGGGGVDLSVAPREFPCVLIGTTRAKHRPCVIEDRFNALAGGVRWLAEGGHRRIAFVASDIGGAMANPHNSQRLKIEGYRAAMQELGLSDDELLLEVGWRPGETRQFVTDHGELFGSITAVMAGNDRIAVEVMSGLSDCGLRVPEDCSVVGFDDTEFAVAVRPRLTTFRPRRAEVGAKAVEMVLELIDGKEVESVTLMPELIERESAAVCRRS